MAIIILMLKPEVSFIFQYQIIMPRSKTKNVSRVDSSAMVKQKRQTANNLKQKKVGKLKNSNLSKSHGALTLRDEKLDNDNDQIASAIDRVCCLAIAIILFNLSWIIPSLIFAYQQNQCVDTKGQYISFSLSTWLQIDAYTRVSLVLLIIVVVIVFFIQFSTGMGTFDCLLCVLNLYNFFYFGWTIVGSALFWGDINRKDLCKGGVKVYLYFLLIMQYLIIYLKCVLSAKQSRRR